MRKGRHGEKYPTEPARLKGIRENRELIEIKHTEARGVRSRVLYLNASVRRDDPCIKQVPVIS